LPQVLVNNQFELPYNIKANTVAELTHFQRTIDDLSDIEINGIRWRFEPEISYDYRQPWGGVKPSLGVRQLAYRLDDQKETSINAATFNLDSHLVFERETKNYMQTIEPRILYRFSPYYQQNNLPNFDTASTTFSYAQLFRARRFSGGDRLEDANQLSLGFTTRWLHPDTSQEIIRASLGEIFYFRDRKVQLNSADPIVSSSTSGVASEVSAQLAPDWSSSIDALWTESGDVSQLGIQAHYLPNTNTQLFNVGYSFRREVLALNQKALRQTNVSFVKPLNDNWQILGLWQYDLLNRETPEMLLGLHYEACCWRMALYRREFLSDLNNTNASSRKRSAFFLEFSLKGLAGLSSGARDLLVNRVFGYSQLK
jgi:LPS-assembly protein